MFNEQIGYRMRKCRERAHLSTVEVGNMVGVRVAEVEKWERGELEPAKRHWEKLSLILGVPSEIITDPTEPLPEPEGTEEERVLKLIDELEAQRETDRATFIRKFPVWQLFGVAYFVVCGLRMGRGMLLADAMQIWVQMLPILIPIPLWYAYRFVKDKKYRRKKT